MADDLCGNPDLEDTLMTKLETVESLVAKIPCPVCLNSRFEVALSCDSAHSPCDVHAICGHCHYRFVVTDDAKTMDDLWPEIQQHLTHKGCPECGDHKLDLEFLCDVKSEDCFFLVRCSENGHYSRVGRTEVQYLFG